MDDMRGKVIGTIPASGRGDFVANMNWINARRDKFKGQWVALRDGGLVDNDKSLVTLQNRLADKAENALFVWIQEN